MDEKSVFQSYMQIPMDQRRALVGAIDPEHVGPLLKQIASPKYQSLVDRIINATPEQVQPGPGDKEETAETETMTPTDEQGAIIDKIRRRSFSPKPTRPGAPQQTVMGGGDDMERLARAMVTPTRYS